MPAAPAAPATSRVPPLKGSIKRPGPMMMSLDLDGLHEEKESHALTVECSSSRSPRIGGLSLELGSSPRGPHVMEDSWKVRQGARYAASCATVIARRGTAHVATRRAHVARRARRVSPLRASRTRARVQGEILPGFLYLGDRMTAGESDRLNSLGITHILNVTQDIPNFYENKDVGTSERRLTYKRCALKDRIDANIAEHFSGACDFINRARCDRAANRRADARRPCARRAPRAQSSCAAPVARARCARTARRAGKAGVACSCIAALGCRARPPS